VGSAIASYFGKDHKIVIVDNDSEVVSKYMKNKINCVYGSVDNKEVWRTVNIEKAKVIILAIPYPKPAIPLIKYIKKIKPNIVVFGRAHYFKDALALYEAGTDFVVMPHVVGSNLFVEKVANYLDTNSIDDIVSFKDEYIEYLRQKSKNEKTDMIER